MRTTSCLLAAVMLLAGCASYPDLPDAIRNPPPGDAPTPSQVSAEPDTYQGLQVRWGGTLLEVRNQSQESWLEVLAYPLERSGRPETSEAATGRFFARVQGFVDPAVFSRGREVSVAGTLGEAVGQKIGGHEYRYPVVDASAHYLWPRREVRRDPYWHSYPYYWRDPFFYYGRPLWLPPPWYW